MHCPPYRLFEIWLFKIGDFVAIVNIFTTKYEVNHVILHIGCIIHSDARYVKKQKTNVIM